VVGVHEYQGRLVALIAVDAQANAPLGRHGHHEVSAARLPVNIAGWKYGWAGGPRRLRQ